MKNHSFPTPNQPTKQLRIVYTHRERMALRAQLHYRATDSNQKKKNDRFVEHGEKSGLNMCVCSSPIL